MNVGDPTREYGSKKIGCLVILINFAILFLVVYLATKYLTQIDWPTIK